MTKQRESGFTILEVLIASMVFTVVLMICVQVITRIGQLYFKGVTSAQIQNLTRDLTDEFSQQIQFGSGIPYGIPNPDSISGGTAGDVLIFCVGDNRYRAIMNRRLGDAGVTTVLQRIPYSGACVTTDTGFVGATELAVKNMRILKLSIIRSTTDPYIWSLNIRLALGEDDQFSYSVAGSTDTPAVYGSAICKSGISGSQFCSISELSSSLLRRVKVE